MAPELMEGAGLPGLALILIEKSRIIEQGYYGSRDIFGGAAIDSETIFEAASQGKVVTAYLILKLSRKGLLKLNQPAGAYLKEPFLSNPEWEQKITIKDLLTHSAGLSNRLFPLDRSIKEYAGKKKFSYSGVGYVLLQKVVESVTGEEFDTVARREVFEPLGMKSSSFRFRDKDAFRMAAPHQPGWMYLVFCLPLTLILTGVLAVSVKGGEYLKRSLFPGRGFRLSVGGLLSLSLILAVFLSLALLSQAWGGKYVRAYFILFISVMIFFLFTSFLALFSKKSDVTYI